MKKLFAFLIVVVICVVAVGFYRSWFTVTSSDTESNKVNVSLTVDPDKVKADTEAVKDKAMELTGQATQGAEEIVDQRKDEPKSDEE